MDKDDTQGKKESNDKLKFDGNSSAKSDDAIQPQIPESNPRSTNSRSGARRKILFGKPKTPVSLSKIGNEAIIASGGIHGKGSYQLRHGGFYPIQPADTVYSDKGAGRRHLVIPRPMKCRGRSMVPFNRGCEVEATTDKSIRKSPAVKKANVKTDPTVSGPDTKRTTSSSSKRSKVLGSQPSSSKRNKSQMGLTKGDLGPSPKVAGSSANYGAPRTTSKTANAEKASGSLQASDLGEQSTGKNTPDRSSCRKSTKDLAESGERSLRRRLTVFSPGVNTEKKKVRTVSPSFAEPPTNASEVAVTQPEIVSGPIKAPRNVPIGRQAASQVPLSVRMPLNTRAPSVNFATATAPRPVLFSTPSNPTGMWTIVGETMPQHSPAVWGGTGGQQNQIVARMRAPLPWPTETSVPIQYVYRPHVAAMMHNARGMHQAQSIGHHYDPNSWAIIGPVPVQLTEQRYGSGAAECSATSIFPRYRPRPRTYMAWAAVDMTAVQFRQASENISYAAVLMPTPTTVTQRITTCPTRSASSRYSGAVATSFDISPSEGSTRAPPPPIRYPISSSALSPHAKPYIARQARTTEFVGESSALSPHAKPFVGQTARLRQCVAESNALSFHTGAEDSRQGAGSKPSVAHSTPLSPHAQPFIGKGARPKQRPTEFSALSQDPAQAIPSTQKAEKISAFVPYVRPAERPKLLVNESSSLTGSVLQEERQTKNREPTVGTGGSLSFCRPKRKHFRRKLKVTKRTGRIKSSTSYSAEEGELKNEERRQLQYPVLFVTASTCSEQDATSISSDGYPFLTTDSDRESPLTTPNESQADDEEWLRFSPTNVYIPTIRLPGEGCGGFAATRRRRFRNVPDDEISKAVSVDDGLRSVSPLGSLAYSSYVRNEFTQAADYLRQFHDHLQHEDLDSLLLLAECYVAQNNESAEATIIRFMETLEDKPEVAHLEIERWCILLQRQHRYRSVVILCRAACHRYRHGVVNKDKYTSAMYCHFADIGFRVATLAPPCAGTDILLSQFFTEVHRKLLSMQKTFPELIERASKTITNVVTNFLLRSRPVRGDSPRTRVDGRGT